MSRSNLSMINFGGFGNKTVENYELVTQLKNNMRISFALSAHIVLRMSRDRKDCNFVGMLLREGGLLIGMLIHYK